MEIVQERLVREFDMNVITTVPNVMYIAHTTKGEVYEMHNPSDMPSASTLDFIEEPFIRAQIITPADYIGPIMTLCLGKRGILINQQYHTGNRIEITYEMPLGEIVFDFYDKLKRDRICFVRLLSDRISAGKSGETGYFIKRRVRRCTVGIDSFR